MIRLVDALTLEEMVAFIEKYNHGAKEIRYMEKDPRAIKSRLNNRLDKGGLLLRVEEDESIGYIECMLVNDESYIQIVSLCIDGEVDKVLDQTFAYIKEEYPDYALDIVLSKKNEEYIQYFLDQNFASTGFEQMMVISLHGKHKEVKKIDKLSKEDYEIFSQIHDQIFKDVYWTSERLLDKDAPFLIMVHKENDKLLGYSVCSNKGRSEEEVYFLYGESKEIKEHLLKRSMQAVLPTCKSLLYLLEESSNMQPMLEAMGFQEKETIITFSM